MARLRNDTLHILWYYKLENLAANQYLGSQLKKNSSPECIFVRFVTTALHQYFRNNLLGKYAVFNWIHTGSTGVYPVIFEVYTTLLSHFDFLPGDALGIFGDRIGNTGGMLILGGGYTGDT